MGTIKRFMHEEDGMGVVEIVLIIVVLISLVVIFKSQISQIVNDIFLRIKEDAKGV